MNDERIISIAQKAYDYLKRKCIGKQISRWEIFKKVCPDILPDILSVESDRDVCAVVDALCHLLSKERKYVFDPGENTDCYIGTPFFFPFYFRPRWAKSSAWKIRIPYFNSGEEYFDWIADLPELGIPEPYVRYFRRLYQATIHKGYECPIKKEKMIRALKHSQRTGEMIDIVPDKEFLPGGDSEGQCDGWTYHIEFVSMRDYFSADYDERKLIGEELPPKEEWVNGLVNDPNRMD